MQSEPSTELLSSTWIMSLTVGMKGWNSMKKHQTSLPAQAERVWLVDAFKFPMIGQPYKNTVVEFNHHKLTNTLPSVAAPQLAATTTDFPSVNVTKSHDQGPKPWHRVQTATKLGQIRPWIVPKKGNAARYRTSWFQCPNPVAGPHLRRKI